MRFLYTVVLSLLLISKGFGYISKDIVDENGNPYEIIDTEKDLLDKEWEAFVVSGYDNQEDNRYCMRWCPKTMNVTGMDLFPEIREMFNEERSPVGDELSEDSDSSYAGMDFDTSAFESNPKLTRFALNAINKLKYKCCHICTQDCFEVVHDTRKYKGMMPIEASNDVTILTFGTIDRLNAFNLILKRWSGPVVALFYFNDYLDESEYAPIGHVSAEKAQLILKDSAYQNNWDQYDLLVITYTARLQLDKPTMTRNNTIHNEDGTFFPVVPINTFRNVLVDYSKTRYLFPLDMDFIPSEGLHGRVRSMIDSMNGINRAAFVVPHFQTRTCTMEETFVNTYGKDRVPKNFNELKQAIGEQWVTLFHAELTDFQQFERLRDLFPPAKGCENGTEEETNVKNVKMTNNDKWFYESITSPELKASAIPPMHTCSQEMMNKWEPFLIVARVNIDRELPTVPRYNEIFFGRNKNKISFVNALRTFHYHFFYVRHEYIVHMEHPYSIYRLNALDGHYESMKIALREYIKDLDNSAKNMGFEPTVWMSESEPEFQSEKEISVSALVQGTTLDSYFSFADSVDLSSMTGEPMAWNVVFVAVLCTSGFIARRLVQRRRPKSY